MKIRTQFIISMTVLGSLLLLVAVAVAITNQKVESTGRAEILAAQIEIDAYELGSLGNNYLLYRESQPASRWETKFASFSEDVSNLKVSMPGQLARLANIKSYLQQLHAVFTEIKTGIENASQTQANTFDTNALKVSWSRLEAQNQPLIVEATQLTQMLSEEDDHLRQVNIWLSFVLIGVFGAFLLGNYLLTYQRTLKALDRLQAGIRIIGSGNLDFAIPLKNMDEIGELSQAFNQMAANLKQVTASKADLEKEILEREHAEAALRVNEARLQTLYASMTEGLANHTVVYEADKAVDYLLTDVNPAYERLTGIPCNEAVGKKASELYQSGEPPYLEIYARVAAGGRPESFETFFAPMEKNFEISVFSPEKGKFATVFTDITERKRAEQEIQRHVEALGSANAELTQFNNIMVGRELRMIELKKEVDELCRQAGLERRYYQSGEEDEV